MASSIRKKLDKVLSDVLDEMDDPQLTTLMAFIKATTNAGGPVEASEDDEDETEVEEEEEEPVVKKKGKKAAVVEDDEEEEEDEPVVKKKGKASKVVDEDEEEETEDEDETEEEDEEEEPVVKKKGKTSKVVEEEEDDEEEDEDEKPKKKGKVKAAEEDEEDEEGEDDSVDYSSKSVPALKKIAAENGINVKALLKKGGDEKKLLVKSLKAFDANVETLSGKKLPFLEKLIAKHDVEHKNPRGRSTPEKKIGLMARSLVIAGWPFEE